ncbi:TRAP transporter TAXI family solute receptor [Azospirillum lipoferum]|uniref:TAXI family TRAP transporter solute-binding subunit n=1 Tax=Azospirillum lipoferum TaxID=193 RepID=A0A5A9FUZ5_AZOLI|nr:MULTISPECIES: TAXI family TRAP transporter solute-binding subunit [Azospirillum]KAA0585926.1 TAXI family TRAP transporter solute-binding subunit [Azospirillum lipoferum]MCP1615141.1 TRAP transporter TAXI family solute receptor [Azospirillum lipoferum]MDW5533038.1 TAXI family TRAP transporter solute-binding subunit [Azospirillum sp. NL1]
MKASFVRMLAVGACIFGGVWGLAGTAPAADPRGVNANSGTVGIVSGGVEGTYVRIAADLASVLDDGDTLRVLPMLGKGSVQNLKDVVLLKGIDVGIVQSDVLAYAKRERLLPNLDRRVKYIAKLYNEEMHILAGPDVTRIEDLAGRKVNVDVQGSGTAMTASLVFDMLGIKVEPQANDQALALEKLRKGEIAAMAYVAGKPTRLFRDLKAGDGLHFLSIPMSGALLDTYLPSRLTSADYEGLIKPGEQVDTVAVGAVMAVYGWERDLERHRKVARFVDAFFSKFDEFLKPPRHPKWKEVNLAADVPGWTRFEPAEQWLRQASMGTSMGKEPQSAAVKKEEFRSFVEQRGVQPQQAEKLFEQFLLWQARSPQ